MNIIQMRLEDLVPYENNPRNNDEAVDYVANSIKEFGFRVPIVIDKDNVIVAGHTRYKALKKLGWKEVPCTMADDLTPEQIKAYRLADNRVGEIATWNGDKLDLELSDLESMHMELFGFDSAFTDGERERESFSSSDETVEDDYEVELKEKPKAKLGDVYQLGRHRLICGDATKSEDLDKLCNGEVVDMVLTDPPYNVNYEGGTGLTIQNDNLPDEKFRQFLCDAFKNMNKHLKSGGAFYIWHADSEGYNFRQACINTGWQVRQCLVWIKSSIVLGRQDYQWKHEPCLYGWKDGASHNWYGDRKERTEISAFDLYELRYKTREELLEFIERQWCDTEDCETTVLYEEKPLKNAEHPTMKPIKLLSRQINNSTKKGDIVLDVFGGSGSTLMACEQLDRICYTMEYDPIYVDVIIDRYKHLTGKDAVRVKEGE